MLCCCRKAAVVDVVVVAGMIAALALLPENIVHLGLEELKEIADEMPLWTIPLIEYVERVYVGTEGSPARFSPPQKLSLRTCHGHVC